MKKFYHIFSLMLLFVLSAMGAKAESFSFTVKWDNPGAVSISRSGVAVSVGADATEYVYAGTAESIYTAPSLKVSANPGYVIDRVYYVDGEQEKNVITYGSVYTLSVNNYNGKTVNVVTTKAEANATCKVKIVNAPYAIDYIESEMTKYRVENFNAGAFAEVKFNSDTDSRIYIRTNSQLKVDNGDGSFTYGEIYKITRNGKNVTEDCSAGRFEYYCPVADGDVIVVQPYKVDPGIGESTVSLSINDPKALTQIWNQTQAKAIAMGADNTFKVIEGTRVRLTFDEDYTVESITVNDNALTVDGNVVSFVVTADSRVAIVANPTVYEDVEYVAYISAAEGVKIYENNLMGRLIAIGEGEPIAEDIVLEGYVDNSQETGDGSVEDGEENLGSATTDVPQVIMSKENTRKYTFTINSKYDHVLVMSDRGYWVRTVRGSKMTEYGVSGNIVNDQIFYVAAEKVEYDSKMLVYVAGEVGRIKLKPSPKYGAQTDRTITFSGEGYHEVEFDHDYESPFSIGIGEQISGMVVVLDNKNQAPNEDGVYDNLYAKDGSVLKIFATTSARQKAVMVTDNTNGEIEAKVIYDRTFEFSDWSDPIGMYAGTEIAVTPGTGMIVSFDGQLVAADEHGVCNMVVTPYVSTSKSHTITLDFAANSGVENVGVDSIEAQTEYYNLQGVRVAAPAAGSLYIVRQGDKVTKRRF